MRRPQGTLKVYVGMAAGVGKTYAMLEEGQERRRAGEDVVIGWLEPHGRAETSAMAEGLEVVPPLVVEHRGVPLRDMDTDAVHRPRARTSPSSTSWRTPTPRAWPAPSATRTSPCSCDAGIDVISTVNVQHLESLNDRVYELTGVRVRETIPDQVLLDADEVILVDLTPEALQARLRAGKIYPAERVESALLNFFTTANLGTLREVALREVAGAVDEQSQRADPAPGEPGSERRRRPLAERVMVIARPGARAPSAWCARPGGRPGGWGPSSTWSCPEGRLDEEAVAPARPAARASS